MSLASDLIDYIVSSKLELATLKTELLTALSNDAADAETIATAKAAADEANAALTAVQAAAEANALSVANAAQEEAALAEAIQPTPELI